MKEAVIVAAGRTAVGKSHKGALANTRPETMGTAVLGDLMRRAGDLDPALIDDVIIGCVFPEAEQGLNMARILVMSLGWPDRVPAVTVNRFCSSGLEAIAMGAQRIMSGQADVVVAGGVESMTLVPMEGHRFYPNPALVEARPGAYTGMGLTAENVANRDGVSREDQDRFAVESHRRAAVALEKKLFADEIVPVTGRRQKQLANGRFEIEEFVHTVDEGVRADTDMASLGRLKPVFRPGGSVTAGNASQTSDGAAGVVLMSREKANELGLKPLAAFRQYAVEGCDPEYMGLGPIYAIPKALERAGVALKDVDLIELNEAFAAQSLQVIRVLGLDTEKTNVNGGAIALGHPLGCTGAKLTTQLIYEMRRRGSRFGLVSMCIGLGMGAAGLFELEDA